MAEDLYNNATPGYCVACGTRARRNICFACLKLYRDASGRLPDWLIALKNDQNRLHMKQARGGIAEISVGLTPRAAIGNTA